MSDRGDRFERPEPTVAGLPSGGVPPPWARLFHLFVRTRIRELFVLGALGICLAMAWMTHSFGFSLALGAFVAGIIVSETEYSHQVVAEILPLRDLFSSVFFVSIGMLLDFSYLRAEAPLVGMLVLAAIAVKALVATAAVVPFRPSPRIATIVGFSLAQIGEFSFVLAEEARRWVCSPRPTSSSSCRLR